MSDLHSAGTETTTETLRWAIYFLASFPEVQKTLHEEISRVLPEQDRMATLEDKPQLPYTEAFINETLRYSSLASNGVMRVASEDTTIGGYFIPKGTILNSPAYYIHFNPKIWGENAKEFEPKRFLDSDGKFNHAKQGFFAFGSGQLRFKASQLYNI